jgi:hypothetical protein
MFGVVIIVTAVWAVVSEVKSAIRNEEARKRGQ